MSKLEVDKIDPQSGTNLELGTSGDTVTIPTGVTLDASNATTTLPATVVTTTGSQTLTNKTIAAGSNTVTGLTNSNLSGSAAISNANLANSSITINGSSVSLGGTTSIASGMFRNIIINGDMSIAQRGTSTASITSAGYYTVDRFRTALSSLGTFTQSQDSDVPSGQGFATSLKMDCTTADAAPSASDQLIIQQRIEGQMLQYLKKGTANAESLTLSFWVKSNKTGTYVVNILDNDNSRQISNSYTINASNTWEKKTLTFAGDTTGTFGNDNNTSIELNFWLGAGSTYTSGTLQTSWTSTANADLAVGQVNFADSTSNDFWITGVQLEAGTSASDFEFLPVDINLGRCQRYFISHEKYMAGTGDRWSTNFAWCGFKVGSNSLRAVPTVTKDDGATTDIAVVMNAGNRDSNADLNSVYTDTDHENWKSGYITLVLGTSYNPDNARAIAVAFNRNLHIDSEL